MISLQDSVPERTTEAHKGPVPLPIPLPELFWPHVDFNGPVHPALGTACWLWTGKRDIGDYGYLRIPGRTIRVHRVALEAAEGTPLGSLCALHKCDNPPCVNPAHLFRGTRGDNWRDCLAKGRHPKPNRTHCDYGHEYIKQNTYIDPHGWRHCRTCDRLRKRGLSKSFTPDLEGAA